MIYVVCCCYGPSLDTYIIPGCDIQIIQDIRNKNTLQKSIICREYINIKFVLKIFIAPFNDPGGVYMKVK